MYVFLKNRDIILSLKIIIVVLGTSNVPMLQMLRQGFV